MPTEFLFPFRPQMRNVFVSVPTQIIRNVCSLICCLIKTASFLSSFPVQQECGDASGNILDLTCNMRDLLSEKTLTTDLHALIKAVLTVVFSITQPLLGNALVLWTGELVPQARRVCRRHKEENFSTINQTNLEECTTKTATAGEGVLIKA